MKIARRTAAALILVLSLLPAGPARADSEVCLLFVSDTYGCLGYPGWPGGIARLAHRVREERKLHPGALLLHAGNAISPFYFSRFDSGRLYTKGLDSIGGVVWNLGFHDLDYGWAHLSDLRAGMRDTAVLSSNLTAATTPAESWIVREVGGMKVGIGGLMDSRAAHLTRLGMLEGLQVEDPVEAARRIVAQHRREVDLLVLLADVDEISGEGLLRRVEGVDLIVMGSRHEQDWYTFYEGREPRQVLSRRWPDGRTTTLLSGPRDGFEIGKAVVRVRRGGAGWEVLGVDHEVIPLTVEMREDPALAREVNEHLKDLEARRSTPVLSKLQARFPGRGDENLLGRWVLGALRDGLDAEVSILNEGALFKADFQSRLAWEKDVLTDLDLDLVFWTDNHALKAKLLGKHLAQIVEDDRGIDRLRYDGLERRDGQIFVNGRLLDPAQHYLVATSNYLLAESPKSRGFDAAISTSGKFVREDGNWAPDEEEGGAVILRDLVREQLRSWGERHPEPDGAQPFETEEYPDQRSVHFKNVTLNISDFDARNNELFPQVRNPRIASVDVITVAAAGEIFMRDEDRRRRWDQGLRFEFQKLEFSNAEVNPVDDLLAYSRYTDLSRVVGREGALFGLSFNPFAELAHDSEFSATPGNPRQKLYRLSLGLSELAAGPLDGLRLAVLAEHDRSALANTEYGVSVGINARKYLGKLWLETDTDARYYFRQDDDTPDDLLYEVYSNNQLVVPINSEFSVNFMANLFAYEGKVVRDDGSNLFLGVGIRFDKLWKPRHEDFSG